MINGFFPPFLIFPVPFYMLYDLIILGGGPAGIAAGIFGARKKINALLLTKNFGGQPILSSNIENFIGHKSLSGFELAKILEEHLRAQEGMEIKDGVEIVSIKKDGEIFTITDSNNNVYKTKNLLVVLGKSYRKLNIKGEKEFEGKGVFYCSICDAPFLKGKPVVVIGGGNSGLNAVIDLIPYATEIYLLERGDVFKGDPILQDKMKKEQKVKIITNAQAQEILGEQFVNGLKYLDLKTNEEKTLNVSGVFVEIGYKANSELLKELVDLNNRGEIIVDHKTFQTSCKGIWAAGDVADGLYNQINIAIGDAIKAVLNIYDKLNNNLK